MLQIRLLVVGGEVEEEEYRLSLPAVLGRSREVTLQLAHPLVSRRHCELFERGGRLIVRDLDSLNGTFVGSDRVGEAVVESGALLTVGTVTFRVLYELAVLPDVSRQRRVGQGSRVESAKRTAKDTQDGTDRIDDTPRSIPRPHYPEAVPQTPPLPPSDAESLQS